MNLSNSSHLLSHPSLVGFEDGMVEGIRVGFEDGISDGSDDGVEDCCRLGLDVVGRRFEGNDDELLLGTSEGEATAKHS